MRDYEEEVVIIISSYNGEKYIREQLDSLITQSYQNWKAIIRDDGSVDSTLEIIKCFTHKDARFSILEDGCENLGPAKSFIRLLHMVEAPYFMFCDQDDVWLPTKVEDTVNELKKTNLPHLVFTDLHVVDDKLNKDYESFMRLSRFDPLLGCNLKKLIMQNIVVGCTVAGNEKLLKVSQVRKIELPENIIMHDWWFALVAASFGKLTYLDKKTVLYRQHGKNCLGVKKSGIGQYLYMLSYEKPWLKAQKYLGKVIAQADDFHGLYADKLPAESKDILSRVINIRHGSALKGIISCFLHGITMHKFDRNLALLLSFIARKSQND